MSGKFFLGSEDPNVIILRDIFPCTNVTFSTQLKNTLENFQVVVLEGREDYLQFIFDKAQPLTTASWSFGGPLMRGDREIRLFKKTSFSSMDDSIRLLANTLRQEFRDLCKFVLSDRSHILVREDGKKIYDSIFTFKDGTRGLVRIPTDEDKSYIPENMS